MSETHAAHIRKFLSIDRSAAIERCLARGRESYSIYVFFARFPEVDDWAEIRLQIDSWIGEQGLVWHEEFLLQMLDSGVVQSDHNDVDDYGNTPLAEYYGDAGLQDLKLRDCTTALYILDLDLEASDSETSYETAVMIPRQFVPGLSRHRSWSAAAGLGNHYHATWRHDGLRRRRRRGHALISWAKLSTAFIPDNYVKIVESGDEKPAPRAQFHNPPPHPVITTAGEVRGLDVIDETLALTVTDDQALECDLTTEDCRVIARLDDGFLALQDILRLDDDKFLMTSYELKSGYKKGLVHVSGGQVQKLETKRSLGHVRPERLRRLSDGSLLVWGARAMIRDGDATTVIEEELPERDVRYVAEGREGELWAIGAKKGYVSRFVRGDGGDCLQLRRRKHGLPSQPVSLTVRPGGNAWLFSMDGVYIIDRCGGVERHDAISDWALNPLVAGHFIDETRGWFVNDCGQLVYLEKGGLPRLFAWPRLECVPVARHSYYTSEVELSAHDHTLVASDYSPEITMDSSGGLWFVIRGGLFYISPADLDEMLDHPEINIADGNELATEPVCFPNADSAGHEQHPGPTIPTAGNRRRRHFQKLSRFNRRQRPDETFLGTPVRRLPPELLLLHGVDEITAEEAGEIASWQGSRLALPDLESLDVDAAANLAEWDGNQLEVGLPEVTSKLVQTLMDWNSGGTKKALVFSALHRLDNACAVEFSGDGKEYKRLEFTALNGIDANALKALAGGSTAISTLTVGRFGELTPAKAAIIGASEGIEGIRLLGVSGPLSADAAAHLADFGGRTLHIEGLEHLEADAAASLSGYNRGNSGLRESVLRLEGAFELTADAASHLAGCDCTRLVVSPGKPLSGAAVEALARSEATRMDLSVGAESLDADAAAALADWTPTPPSRTVSMRSELHLRGFERLDPNAATALATWSGEMLAIHAEDISAEALEALTGWSGQILAVDGLKSLTPDTAAILADWRGQGLAVGGVETLDAASAQALAQFSGPGMMLNGLRKLDADAAANIARWDGMQLVLRGLHDLKRQTAEQLADCQAATLVFNESSQLSNFEADAARILAATGFPANND